jgi:N-methylhydantoinase A
VLRGAAPRLSDTPAGPRLHRSVHLGTGARRDIRYAVHERNTLAAGQEIAGPAIVEERETTTVILPGWTARVDATGCIIAQRGSAQERTAAHAAPSVVPVG